MKLYLVLNDCRAGQVHGVDYLKGLVDKDDRIMRECGRIHEFNTRRCSPVYLTEEEVHRLGYKAEEIVEIVPFYEETIDVMTRPEVVA